MKKLLKNPVISIYIALLILVVIFSLMSPTFLTVNNILHLLLYMACFRGIGMEVTIYQALFYNSVSRMLSLVAVVPANIGIAQGVMGVAGSLMGDVFQHGVMVSLLQSVALMIIYIVMGGAFAYPVYRRYSKGKEA